MSLKYDTHTHTHTHTYTHTHIIYTKQERLERIDSEAFDSKSRKQKVMYHTFIYKKIKSIFFNLKISITNELFMFFILG